MRYVERRPVPPGVHGRQRRKTSDYHVRLLEKQRIAAVPARRQRRNAGDGPGRPHLSVQLAELRAALLREPARHEVPVVCDEQLVVEFYSR